MYLENNIIVKKVEDESYSDWKKEVNNNINKNILEKDEDQLAMYSEKYKSYIRSKFEKVSLIKTRVENIVEDFDQYYVGCVEKGFKSMIKRNHLVRSRVFVEDEDENIVYELYISQKPFYSNSKNHDFMGGIEITIISADVKYPIVMDYLFDTRDIVVGESMLFEKFKMLGCELSYRKFKDILETDKLNRDTVRLMTVYLVDYLYRAVEGNFCKVEAMKGYNIYKYRYTDVGFVKNVI